MGEVESMARTLTAKLTGTGIQAVAVGSGVHWHVDAEPIGSRTVSVHCFWYERGISALMLGMNPGNARVRSRGGPRAYEGPEYLVTLCDNGTAIADGRTRSEAEAVASVSRWLGGATLAALATELPFIDEKPRAMRAIGARLHPSLRWEICPEPISELWAYSEGRSCVARLVDDEVTCAFRFGPAQVAYGAHIRDVPAAIASWLVDGSSIADLPAHVPGIELEPHTEFIERDPARWHWKNVLDRIADPDDILAPQKELIAKLARSPLASTFYSFSSLHWFCFSASSHYPWVHDGLPSVVRARDGTYHLGNEVCDLPAAVRSIEATLSSYPTKPFFGSAPHHNLPLLTACLEQQGSKLVPKLVQRRAWFGLEIHHGPRTCELLERGRVRFKEVDHSVTLTWPSLHEAARMIRRYLEDGVSLEDIEQEPNAKGVSKPSAN